jgi:cytoskeletal protein CcmA (bactofilin family)
MAIFGKKPESSPQPQASAPPSPPPPPRPRSTPAPPAVAAPKRSFLGPGCELEGDFKGAGSFECRGTFNGTIDIEEDVVIGPGGVATAQLKARRITIEGRLEGNATGGEKVEVGASGHVEGDVRAPAVQFAEGAFFEGNVEMRRAQDEEPGDGGRPTVPTDAAAGESRR